MQSATQLAVALVAKPALLAVLVGVVQRGLYRRCWSFLVYLLAILLYTSVELTGMLFYDVPGLLWPKILWSWDFWHFQQTVYEVLKLAIAVELGVRVVAAFPGTWRLERALLAATLVSITCILTFGGAPQHPLLATGTIVLFAATSLVILFFHLPVHAWYRALLVGFVPYLFVFGTTQSILSRRGLEVAALIGSIDSVAYLALIGWWIVAAWRSEEEVTGINPAVLRRLGLARA